MSKRSLELRLVRLEVVCWRNKDIIELAEKELLISDRLRRKGGVSPCKAFEPHPHSPLHQSPRPDPPTSAQASQDLSQLEVEIQVSLA